MMEAEWAAAGISVVAACISVMAAFSAWRSLRACERAYERVKAERLRVDERAMAIAEWDLLQDEKWERLQKAGILRGDGRP